MDLTACSARPSDGHGICPNTVRARAFVARQVIVLALAFSFAWPAQPAAAFQWTATLRTKIGAVDGPSALAPVWHVEMGKRGEVLIIQPSTRIISVYDSTGAFLREIGGVGDGPGEFRSLGRAGWTGDTLWVMDPAASRLHLFGKDFEFLRTLSPVVSNLPRGVARMLPGPLMADGWILGIPLTLGPLDAHPMLLISRSGSVRRTLPDVPARAHRIAVHVGNRPPIEVANPWDTSPLWAPTADRGGIIVVGRPAATNARRAAFSISRIDLGGDTIFRRFISYTPRELTDDEREDAHVLLAKRLSDHLGDETRLSTIEAAVRNSLPAPDFFPPVSELLVGRDGTVWLKREVAGSEDATWWVFSDSGEPLAEIRLPIGLSVFGADRRTVWGMTTDELDVPYVEVYTIRSAQPE